MRSTMACLLLAGALLAGCDDDPQPAGPSGGEPAAACPDAGAHGGGADAATPGDDAGRDAAGPADAGADTGPGPDPVVRAYDGTYVVTFHRDGLPKAIGRLDVVDGAYRANFVNIAGERFDFDGQVAADGTFLLDPVVGRDGTVIEATGVLRDRVIEGTYTADGEPGAFAGSLENRSTEAAVAEYDGAYDVTFVRSGEERASAVLVVRGGRFSVAVTSVDDRHFQVEGFITSDGTFVLNSIQDEGGYAVVAEAFLDRDTGRIEGIYRLDDTIGLVQGRRAD